MKFKWNSKLCIGPLHTQNFLVSIFWDYFYFGHCHLFNERYPAKPMELMPMATIVMLATMNTTIIVINMVDKLLIVLKILSETTFVKWT